MLRSSVWRLATLAAAVVVAIAAGVTAGAAGPDGDVVATDDPVQMTGAGDTSAGLTLEQMTAGADLIAIGTGGARHYAWEDGDLVTRVNVSVTEVLKGEDRSAVEVTLPGGIDANRKIPIAVTYPGAPQIGANESVILFLRATEIGNVVTGFADGKFSITEDSSGEKLVVRDQTDLSRSDGSLRSAVPLEDFKQAVSDNLEAGS